MFKSPLEYDNDIDVSVLVGDIINNTVKDIRKTFSNVNRMTSIYDGEYVLDLETGIERGLVSPFPEYTKKRKQDISNAETQPDDGTFGDMIGSDVQETKKVKPKKIKKFKIGERYYLYPMNNKKLRREFIVKKTIYSIKDKEVNIVIMKQTSGPETTKFTLSKEDCLKFHLKFEEGLQVCSMESNWKLIKTK